MNQTLWTPNKQWFYIFKIALNEKERGYEPLLRPPGGGGFENSRTDTLAWLLDLLA
nr:hypothetical protein Q903MT_gene1022 [Picea sitchensis]